VPGRVPQSDNPSYSLYQWFHGSPPPNNTYGVIIPSISIVARGLTMAGPKLTPTAFRDGLFRYPPSGGDPVNPQDSWGKHGFWPTVDYNSSDDAGMLWWDPTAPGEDEIGHQGSGEYQYASRGARYTLGKFPAKGQGGLFDTASAVTVFPQLPPASSTPNYPPPSG
jgi:hypothetical protein